jgi:integrase
MVDTLKLADLPLEIRRGRGVTVSTDAPITFEKLVQLYEDKYVKGRKLRTADDFKYRVKPLLARFGPLPITQIRRGDIDDFQAALRQRRLIHGEERQPSKASINRPVSLLRGVLNWAVAHEYLSSSPFRRSGVSVVRLDREDNNRNRRISSDEEDRLLAAAPPELRALMILALDTGMRAGEMLSIRVCDVDLDRGEIKLRGVTTKSAKTRILPIATVRLRAVADWLRSLRSGDKVLRDKKPSEPLVSNEDGEELAGLRTAWTTAVLKAHGQAPIEHRPLRDKHTARLLPWAREALRRIDLHWHDLRHEYACRLAERGVPVTKVQALLGHASVTTTMRYIHHTLDEWARATAVL